MHRLSVPIVILFLGCAPSQKAVPPPAAPLAAPAAARPAEPRCGFALRRVSAPGHGGARPQIAVSGDAFAVAWEETTDHRSVRVETFDEDARPLGPSIELADLSRSGAEPRVAALRAPADGFVVFWATQEGDKSVIAMRRVDRAGKPKSDVVPVVTAPGARPLAALATAHGLALAWWNWTGTPHEVQVSYLDPDGHALGRPFVVTRAPPPDPDLALASAADVGGTGGDLLAWEELVDGVEHVFVGQLGRDRIEGRVDLGAGETPAFGHGVVVWQRPAAAGVYLAPLAGGTPVRLADGHVPAAAARPDGASALCLVRDTSRDEKHRDELVCGTLAGARLTHATRVTSAPRGVLALELAADPARVAAAWQTQEDDDTSIAFATLSCPAAAASARR